MSEGGTAVATVRWKDLGDPDNPDRAEDAGQVTVLLQQPWESEPVPRPFLERGEPWGTQPTGYDDNGNPTGYADRFAHWLEWDGSRELVSFDADAQVAVE
jgi:YD repeat-containing protein